MDTDVEVLKPLDDILRYAAVSGFETRTEVMTGFMACEKGHPMYLELLRSYENAHFIKKDGTYDVTTNVARITNLCLGYGLKANNTFQIVNGITLFPKEYFSPKSFDSLEYEVTKNTYTVHHFDGSWLSEEDGLALNIKRKYAAYMPKKLAGAVARFLAALHFRGIRCAVKEIVLRIMKEV